MKKRKYLYPLFLIIILTLSGCTNEGSNDIVEYEETYYSFTDSLDKKVVLDKKPERVISLVGSYAETWVLAGGELVGVTNDVISEDRIELTKDTKIVGTIKEPNIEKLLSLNPDFVLLSPDVESHLNISEILEKANIPHAYFKVEYFEDYLNMLDILTDITDSKELYEENGLKVQKEIDDIVAKVESNEKSTILFVRAFSGGAKAKKDDNMTCKMLEDLGTINIAAQHPSLLEELSIEEIIEEDPDYIFVTTMGDEEKAIQALKNGIEMNPAWSNLTAVKNDRYIILPKNLFHYKPNAKWGESYRYLAEIIYPEVFR